MLLLRFEYPPKITRPARRRQSLTETHSNIGYRKLIIETCSAAPSFAPRGSLMRLMSSLLFNVNAVDPVTYGTVSLGLAGTAWLASYLPSRRAATVDPVQALRAE